MSFKDLSKKTAQPPKAAETKSPNQSPATKDAAPAPDYTAHSPKKS
ncbi:hypothetical protein [Limimaricola pyoseonensis]|uniref:Uncharacterized protein n=1 Tax=Limimaricola pyoseonensis TaxID=521013 RepID=A0A1G7GSG0_9RHOB|nr:hypothetical protein [Limimaricola pyoseonensis]SDE91085.1 hypothetical protein SAMN04488567_2906 [Limimaricola pyoseonensis]